MYHQIVKHQDIRTFGEFNSLFSSLSALSERQIHAASPCSAAATAAEVASSLLIYAGQVYVFTHALSYQLACASFLTSICSVECLRCIGPKLPAIRA